MANKIDLNQALANCLEALEREESTLGECLDLYPQHREELSALLGKFSVLQALPVESAREEFRKKGHQQLLNEIQTRQTQTAREGLGLLQRGLGGGRQWRLKPAQVIAAAALALCMVTGGVAYASNAAAPGDRLYGLDRALEQVRLRITKDEAAAAALHLRFAEERLQEFVELVGEGDIDLALEAVDGYGLEISALAKMVGSPEGINDQAHTDLVNAALNKHSEVLNEVLEKVPEKAQQAIQKALDKQNNVPGFLKEKGQPEDAGKPEDTGKPDKTGKPEKTGQPEHLDENNADENP